MKTKNRALIFSQISFSIFLSYCFWINCSLQLKWMKSSLKLSFSMLKKHYHLCLKKLLHIKVFCKCLLYSMVKKQTWFCWKFFEDKAQNIYLYVQIYRPWKPLLYTRKKFFNQIIHVASVLWSFFYNFSMTVTMNLFSYSRYPRF